MAAIQALILQRLDSVTLGINHYLKKKYDLAYSLDCDLSSGVFIHLLNYWGLMYRLLCTLPLSKSLVKQKKNTLTLCLSVNSIFSLVRL